MIYEVQGNYGYGHGWECVTAEETFTEAKERLREYRENEPGVPFRIVIPGKKRAPGVPGPDPDPAPEPYTPQEAYDHDNPAPLPPPWWVDR